MHLVGNKHCKIKLKFKMYPSCKQENKDAWFISAAVLKEQLDKI